MQNLEHNLQEIIDKVATGNMKLKSPQFLAIKLQILNYFFSDYFK